jgi:hypothetical protein
MHQSASAQGQAQQARKPSAVVAALGAAIVASAITLTMAMSNPAPAAVSEPAAAATAPQCKVVLRQFLVSTNAGGGTVRLREGSYLSGPIVLGAQPQTVTFPVPRPDVISGSEVVTIEGDASDVVLTSPVTSWRRVFQSVHGVTAFEANWLPVKTC